MIKFQPVPALNHPYNVYYNPWVYKNRQNKVAGKLVVTVNVFYVSDVSYPNRHYKDNFSPWSW